MHGRGGMKYMFEILKRILTEQFSNIFGYFKATNTLLAKHQTNIFWSKIIYVMFTDIFQQCFLIINKKQLLYREIKETLLYQGFPRVTSFVYKTSRTYQRMFWRQNKSMINPWLSKIFNFPKNVYTILTSFEMKMHNFIMKTLQSGR